MKFCPKCYKLSTITRISAAFEGAGGGWKLISAWALIRVNTVLSGITMVLSSALK